MNVLEKTDSELVSEYKNGNDKAFAVLLKRHKSKVFSTIYLIVKDRDVAEDLLQDVFIKAIDYIRQGKYNEEGKFIQWIGRMAHNLAIDYFRRNKRYPSVVLEEGLEVHNNLSFSELSAEDNRIKKETSDNLRQLVQNLPENQRDVLLMRHYADMSFQEIADVTGVSINTALGRMRYALINLKKQYEKSNVHAYDQQFYS